MFLTHIGTFGMAAWKLPALGVSSILPVASMLSALLACCGWMIGLFRKVDDRPGPTTPTATACFTSSLVFGACAVILVTCALTLATWLRLTAPGHPAATLAFDGVWILLALLLAVSLGMAAGFKSWQPVLLLILLALTAWWTGMSVPAADVSFTMTREPAAGWRPAWWTWSFQVQSGLSLLLVVAALWQEIRYRAKRRRAWPDRLSDLIEPYSRWPAYIRTESVIAAAVLILGVYQIVSPHPVGWQLALAGSIASLAAGVTCLFMTYRRWSGNTAGLGIALVTLAAVVLACCVAMLVAPMGEATEYARRVPVLDMAVLAALAMMIALWSWLAGVWQQQLRDGVPWTTTGRMLPHTHRAVFLLSALAVLVAFRMAMWPRLVATVTADVSGTHLVTGVIILLVIACLTGRRARKVDSAADATLSVSLLIACVVFVSLRTPPSTFRGWIVQYEPSVLGAICLPLLVLAETLHKTRWRSFSTPLWFLALLVFPVRSLILLLSPQRPAADWIQPMTLAILGAVFAFAGSREHRRAMLVLGGVLLLAALTTFCRAYGNVMLSWVFG